MIQRLSNGIWEEIRPILAKVSDQIKTRLRDADSELRRGELALLLRDIQDAFDEGKSAFDETLRERVIEFAKDEAEFQKQTFEQITDEPVEPVPEETITGEVMTVAAGLLIAGTVTQNVTFNQAVDRQFLQNVQDVKNTVSTGFIAQAPTESLTRQVDQKVGTRMTNQSRAVVATMVNHAANVTRGLFVRANEALVQNERYVAVLDARTTMRCAGLDGEVFARDEGPQPPLHYNCRSIRVPIIRPEAVSERFRGNRTAEGLGGERQTVSPRTTFSSWLREQPVEFRDEFFGKFTNGAEKRRLFDYGGLNPNDFIDPSGAQMSLTELRQKYPQAWNQADL
jgi:SPP1 gp7 family putative phage head morphogenesis protein